MRRNNVNNEREINVKYFFQDETDKRISVCKTFFLTTLGYNKKNDRYVWKTISRSENHSKVIPNMRGRLKKWMYLYMSRLFMKGYKPQKFHLQWLANRLFPHETPYIFQEYTELLFGYHPFS